MARELPHDFIAEKALIGCLLVDNNSFDEISNLKLKAKDFYHPQFGMIFDAIENLVLESRPFDLVSVCSKLNDLAKLEKVGGQSAVLEIIEDTASAANIYHYATLVKDKSTLREVIRTANRVSEAGSNFVGNVRDFIDEVEGEFFNLTADTKGNDLITLKESLKENLKQLERGDRNAGEISGLSTGFGSIDNRLLGLQPGQMVIIAARPGMGKTSLALNWVTNVAKATRLPVLMFSLEMVSSELSMKILSAEASIDSRKIRTKDYHEGDLRNMANAVQTLSQVPIYINDSGATTLIDIRSQSRKVKAQEGLGMVVIDYLQLMQSHVRKQSREQEIAEISRGLKELAKELGCPIIALSQLNRSAAARTDRRPQLQDLRESGSIEQDADIVCLIHREEVYNPDTPEKGIAELIIAKNRAGQPGTVKLAWIGSQTKFAELQFEDQSPEQ